MEEILDRIEAIINTYESGEWASSDRLRELQRDLTAHNYYLSKYSIEFYEKHNSVKFHFTGSAAKGQILADHKFPQLRMIRKIMEAVDHVIWSMRSEISIIKKEN